jgi:hypothetical protein
MKKLIYEIMSIAVVISFAGNTLAAKGNDASTKSKPVAITPAATSPSISDFDGQSFANTYQSASPQQRALVQHNGKILNDDSFKVFNVTPEQLAKEIQKGTHSAPIYLSLKKDPIADAVQKTSSKPSQFQAIPNFNSSNSYGVVVDPQSGITFELKKSSAAAILASSPRASHLAALANATTHTLAPKNIVLEGAPFYAAVGANHVIDLLKDYEKNPMALEMFVEELKTPMGYTSLFSFMIGNKYAQTIMEDMVKRQSLERVMSGRAESKASIAFRAGLPFLSMVVGALASNISSDLLTIAKPCADALYKSGESKSGDPSESFLGVCEQGFQAVLNSDNLARYVTTTASTFLAATASTVVEKVGGFIIKKTIPMDAIVFYFKKAASVFARAPLASAAEVAEVVPTPSRFGIKALGNVILFLQADEIISPYVHYSVESIMNSAPKLASAKKDVATFLNKMDSNHWQDVYTPAVQNICKKTITDITNTNKDYMPGWIQNESRQCSEGSVEFPGLESLLNLHEKNVKWRETLSYDFMSNYMNWVRYVAEFTVMHDVSQKYYSDLMDYVSAKDADIKSNSDYYNPLAFDDPFYGVLPSERFPIENPKKYKIANLSKAQRVLEVVPLIDQALARVTSEDPNNLVTAKNLNTIKTYIGIYQKYPTVENQKNLVEAIKLINLEDKSADSLIASSKAGRDRYTIAAEYQRRARAISRGTQIKMIRNYLGNPLPLKKGAEAFTQMINDYVKTEKPDYAKLFDEKGTPGETLTWYAVCGNTLAGKDARVDRRRTGFAVSIDNGINSVLKATNSVTNWLASKMNTKNNLEVRTDVAPALNLFKVIKYGTGVDFYAPKIVTGNLESICGLAGKSGIGRNSVDLYPILPSNDPGKMKILLGKKSYDSLFSYMIANIKPEVLSAFQNSAGETIGSDFAAWWEKTVTPKVALAHEGFVKDYSTLLETTYKDSVDGKLGRNDPSLKGVDQILNASKALPWGNASNLVQSFSDEMNVYLNVLDHVYAATVESKNPTVDIKLFKTQIVKVKATIYYMLNNYRSSLVDPKTKDATTLSERYALLLFQLQDLYESLGFKNQVIVAAAKETLFFKNKHGVESLSPMERLKARLDNDGTINGPFNHLLDSRNQAFKTAKGLTYGLTQKNLQIQMSGDEIQKVDLVNFTSNSRLSAAYLAANQLDTLAEDLYKTVNILELASVGANFKDIEMRPPSAPGSVLF